MTTTLNTEKKLTASEARKLFPGLNDKVFLDAACVSLIPTSAKAAIENFLDMALYCRAKDASLHHIEMDKMRLEPIEEAAKLLNVPTKNICLVESTTHGLNIAANTIPLEEGDTILIPDTEFLQVSIPWMKKQEKINLTIKEVKTKDSKLTVEDFAELIDEKTKVICTSSVQWCTGHRIDIEALGKLCKEKNIWLVVDGVHEMGALDVDLSHQYVDFYIAGGHKWLNSPFGCGVMCLSDKVLDTLEPDSYGYLATEDPEGGWGTYFRTPSITPFDNFKFLRTAKRFEIAGTSNYPGAIGLGKSLALVNQIGIRNVEKRIRELTNLLHQELNKLNVSKVTKEDGDLRSGITVFSYFNDPEKDLALANQLLKKKIYISLRYTSNLGGLRISTHYFNNEEDIFKLIQGIKEATK
ncbi:aminotransferase class V-fold PLP-dependent enzyme [Candidatus Neptunochlamydia vexilliferae]|uniref:Aminotransferase class V domain-containing protein n=1 Tax=Candidatus Neptunichlamydia vexilliferae TaxID=1651774 RepID=A0ABS0AXD7_9BACT|nr:aminotransferase class V-fold PLP-dependent enzyme [Candidatus Neptunochlamydia vexilliferae]MBF5058802.1 hypothetical protein [Candidatus Neptunochlamydia vexilliferae]